MEGFKFTIIEILRSAFGGTQNVISCMIVILSIAKYQKRTRFFARWAQNDIKNKEIA